MDVLKWTQKHPLAFRQFSTHGGADGFHKKNPLFLTGGADGVCKKNIHQ